MIICIKRKKLLNRLGIFRMDKRLKNIFLLTLSLFISTIAVTQTLDSILVDTLNTVDDFEIDSSKVIDSLDVFEEDYSLEKK